MACTDRCYDCGAPVCENLCTCQTPDYSNIGECKGSAEITNCVNYSGIDDTCLAIVKPIGLTSVLQKIIAYVKNIFNRVSSDSLVITTPGSCDDLKIEIVPSADSGNLFELGSDGYPFVSNLPVMGSYDGAGNVCLDITDGDDINDVIDALILRTKDTITNVTSDSLYVTQGTGCDVTDVIIELVPSTDTNNILVLGTDGLPYVPEPDVVTPTVTSVANGLHFASSHVSPGSATILHFGGTLIEDTSLTGAFDVAINTADITLTSSTNIVVDSSGDIDLSATGQVHVDSPLLKVDEETWIEGNTAIGGSQDTANFSKLLVVKSLDFSTTPINVSTNSSAAFLVATGNVWGQGGSTSTCYGATADITSWHIASDQTISSVAVITGALAMFQFVPQGAHSVTGGNISAHAAQGYFAFNSNINRIIAYRAMPPVADALNDYTGIISEAIAIQIEDQKSQIGSGIITKSYGIKQMGTNDENLFASNVNLQKVISNGSLANDTDAATAGVPIGGLYHTAGAVKIRLT